MPTTEPEEISVLLTHHESEIPNLIRVFQPSEGAGKIIIRVMKNAARHGFVTSMGSV
jgi:hypothetical protein